MFWKHIMIMLLKWDSVSQRLNGALYHLICNINIGKSKHLRHECQSCFIAEEEKFLRKWPNNSKLSRSLGLIGVDDAKPLLQNHSWSFILHGVEWDELSVVVADLWVMPSCSRLSGMRVSLMALFFPCVGLEKLRKLRRGTDPSETLRLVARMNI